jgi:preprotein translocase subunit SecE
LRVRVPSLLPLILGWRERGIKEEMTKATPAQFVREVRQELSKVTWPSRKETILTTIMVFIIMLIAAVFFMIADTLLSHAVEWVLKLGVSS